jgi:hypothetical protein
VKSSRVPARNPSIAPWRYCIRPSRDLASAVSCARSCCPCGRTTGARGRGTARVLVEFGLWLDRERGLSPMSVRCYCKQTKYVLASVGCQEAVSGLDAGKVTAFIVDWSRGPRHRVCEGDGDAAAGVPAVRARDRTDGCPAGRSARSRSPARAAGLRSSRRPRSCARPQGHGPMKACLRLLCVMHRT